MICPHGSTLPDRDDRRSLRGRGEHEWIDAGTERRTIDDHHIVAAPKLGDELRHRL